MGFCTLVAGAVEWSRHRLCPGPLGIAGGWRSVMDGRRLSLVCAGMVWVGVGCCGGVGGALGRGDVGLEELEEVEVESLALAPSALSASGIGCPVSLSSAAATPSSLASPWFGSGGTGAGAAGAGAAGLRESAGGPSSRHLSARMATRAAVRSPRYTCSSASWALAGM